LNELELELNSDKMNFKQFFVYFICKEIYFKIIDSLGIY